MNKKASIELINFDKYTEKLSRFANISYEAAYIKMNNKLKSFNKSNKKKHLSKLASPSREIYKHCKKLF
jgi:hypothetical protein